MIAQANPLNNRHDICEVCGSTEIGVVAERLQLCRCLSCGFLFRSPRPSPDQIATYYSAYDQYDNWLDHETARDLLWRRRLRMVQRYGRKGRLLDVGAGIGQFLALAKQYFEVEGTEVSSRAIEIAKAKYGLILSHGTIEQVNFGERRFEVITVFHVLEHVESPRSLLLRCRELLTSDGLIIVAVPNETLFWKLYVKRLLTRTGVGHFEDLQHFGLKPLVLDRPGLEIHLSHFNSETLRHLFARCGLSVIDEDVDPCHALSGFQRVVNDTAYYGCSWLRRATGINFGEAIWMAAAKSTQV